MHRAENNNHIKRAALIQDNETRWNVDGVFLSFYHIRDLDLLIAIYLV